jgi:hypothetical protein
MSKAGAKLVPGNLMMSLISQPFSPGRDHFQHVLRRGGFGRRQTLGFLTGLQCVYALVGLVGNYYGMQDYILFAAWSVLAYRSDSSFEKSPDRTAYIVGRPQSPARNLNAVCVQFRTINCVTEHHECG